MLTVGSFPAYSGAFLLTIDNFGFFTYNWSCFAYSFSFTYSWSFFAYSGKVRLTRALRDCKQRSLTVSKKAPPVSKKASPNVLCHPLGETWLPKTIPVTLHIAEIHYLKNCPLPGPGYLKIRLHNILESRALFRERKMRTKFFCTNFLNTARGPGHPGKIPGTSRIPLRNPRKTKFRGRARSFRPPPLRVEDPHPTGRSPDPKT